MPLHIFNVVEPRGQRVVHVDYEDFPVGLAFIEQRHDTQYFDLLDLTSVSQCFSDFAHVERVVVTVCTGFRVLGIGVFPGLGEGSVVPEVPWKGELKSTTAAVSSPWWGKQFRT